MMETSKWWWIKSETNSNSSPWLNSTLSELDAKTKEILQAIDEFDNEAAEFSIVKRAKFHYEKKPKLIATVEDLYRSYRSLAQKHDLLLKKSSSLNVSTDNSPTYDDEFPCEEKPESEVDDGEEGQVVEVGDNGGETMKEDQLINVSSLDPTGDELCEEKAESEVDDGEEEEDQVGGETMKEELERLREENRVYKEMMVVKEKRSEVTSSSSLFRDSIKTCSRVFRLFPFQLGLVLCSPLAFWFTTFLGLY